MDNLILMSDSYKVTHYKQYPPDTEKIYSYFESRGGFKPKTVFFGLQYYLKKYLQGQVVFPFHIEEAQRIFSQHFGSPELFNNKGWNRLIEKHNSKLPIKIRAVPEGTPVETSNVLMTIENTDPEFYWLTNYLETLLVQVWYPTTVATISYYCRNLIHEFAEETGDPTLVDFKLHDFGFRGVSSVESAMIGGLAHLLNFRGTDTMAALSCCEQYYNSKNCPGFSIPASEHSTITSWGVDNEYKAMENMLDQYPKGLVACVSDSFDIHHACSYIWGNVLKEKVLTRDGTLVIRPDSGYPPVIITGILDILGEKFGYEKNSKGYRVLNNKVRVIQGDGVDYEMIRTILHEMKIKNWSTDNIAFGMGGALLQKLNRDTQRFAFKCSSIKRNGQWFDVWKQPISDNSKNSKRGRLSLVYNDELNKFQTIKNDRLPHPIKDELVTVFENGEILKEYTFEQCKDNLNKRELVNA